MMAVSRAIKILITVVVTLGIVGYGAASYVVWDELTAVPGGCHAEWAANDPTSFTYDIAVTVDTGPYLMPEPAAVTIPSREPGIDVGGWWVQAADPGAPAVVVVHGQTACKRDPAVLLPAGMLHRAGLSVLLIDLRDHGDSTREDGRYAGGSEEYLDVLGAWDWLQGEGGLPADRIGLLGISLGAATVLIAAGEEPGVAATWEDSSYADIEVAIRAELRRNGYPEILEIGGVAAARILSGDDLTSRSPLEAVGRMRGRDLFITHGTADDRLSVTYASDLLAAAQATGVEVASWIVPGAGHAHAMGLEPAEYEARLTNFFATTIGSSTD